LIHLLVIISLAPSSVCSYGRRQELAPIKSRRA
jgi:hypothetical protein